VPWHRGSGCLGAAAPVTGAAADEHNLNVVDCDASVTGVPQPPEANVKDNGFPWPPPGLLGICFPTIEKAGKVGNLGKIDMEG